MKTTLEKRIIVAEADGFVGRDEEMKHTKKCPFSKQAILKALNDMVKEKKLRKFIKNGKSYWVNNDKREN